MSAISPPPADYGDLHGEGNVGGFRYGITVSIGILLIVTTITLTSYYCTRNRLSRSQPSQTNNSPTPGGHVVIDLLGLDEATIKIYPKILYSEAKMKKGDSTASCCSICLADYKGSDLLRQLPDCNHMFHVRCIDTWLRLNPTCPICRTSPLPSPVSTPLAEVVPLTAATRSR